MSPLAAARGTRATTIRIPQPIYDQAKKLVDPERHGTSVFLSLNDFFVTAIQAYVKLYQRRQIDAAFASMAEDSDYQKEACLLAEEFEASDWEALRLGEESLAEEEPVLVSAGSTR